MDPQLQQSGIFVLVIFLAVLAERGWQWLLRRRARTWPACEGRVHTAEWHQPRTGTNRYFISALAYYYFVDGHFYSGYFRRSFSKAEDAANWVRRMHGTRILVRYDAHNQGRSMLLEDEQQSFAESVPAQKSEMVVAGD